MPGNLYLMLHCHSQHGEALSVAAFRSQTRSKITRGGARGDLYLMLHCHSQHSEALSVAAAGATLMVQYFEGRVHWSGKVTKQCPQTTLFGEKGELNLKGLLKLVQTCCAIWGTTPS